MTWELVTTLPQGSPSRTLLARCGDRLGVLRATEFEPHLINEFGASPAVLPLRELADVAGARYAVFDLVAGLSLREVLEGLVTLGRPLPVGLLCTVVLHAARALASVTPARPHGGLGSGALLIGCDGVTRVLDFGSPRLSRFQLGVRPTFEGDVFALGAVLHSALTGFTGHYGDCVNRGLPLSGPSAANPDVSPRLDQVVLRALENDPAARQPTVARFAEALEAVTAELLLTPQQVAHSLHEMLARRRAWLDEVLAGVSPGLNAAPQPEGNAATQTLADEHTQADRRPWSSLPEQAQAEQRAPGAPANPLLDQALAATALSSQHTAPTALVPAAAPFETEPSAVPREPGLEDTRLSRTELVEPHAPLDDSDQHVPAPDEPSEQPTVVERPPAGVGRARAPREASERGRRRARSQDLVPTSPLEAGPIEPPAHPQLSRGALIAVGLGLGSLVLGLGAVLVFIVAPGWLAERTPALRPAAPPAPTVAQPPLMPEPIAVPSEDAGDRLQVVDAGELNVDFDAPRVRPPRVKKQVPKRGPATKPPKKKHR